MANEEKIDVDLCGTINYWKLSFDFEGLTRERSMDDSINPSGFYTGVLWIHHRSLAWPARRLVLSDNNFRDMDMRVTGGLTFAIKDGIYCSVEFSRRMPSEG